MTFDPSEAVSMAIENNMDALEHIEKQNEHMNDAMEFLHKKAKNEYSGQIANHTIRSELRTQLKNRDVL